MFFEKEFINCVKEDISKLSKLDKITIAGIHEYTKIENNKHFTLLILINLIKYIKDNEEIFKKNIINVSMINLCYLIDDYINEELLKTNDEIINKTINEYELIDDFRLNYISGWKNYQDFVGKLIREILNKIVTITYIEKLLKADLFNLFIYFIYVKSIENINLPTKIYDLIKNNLDEKIEFSDDKILMISSFIHDILNLKCNVYLQYNMVLQILKTCIHTSEFINTLNNLNENIIKNKEYITNNFSINENTINLFKSELKIVPIGAVTYFDSSKEIEDFLNCKIECQCLDIYNEYKYINLKSIISNTEYINKDDVIIQYLGSKNIDLIEYYLKLFKFQRPHYNNNYKDLTMGEKQRLAIIKILIEDKDIMIFNDCFNCINDETKENIIKLIESMKNKTILIKK